MRVLLVRPKAPNVFRFSRLVENEPIELEYLLTTLLALGNEAQIYDGIFDSRPLKNVLKKIKPDLVAITGYITQENAMKAVATLVKKVDANILTVAGGVHVQLNPDSFKTPVIDFIFRSASMQDFEAFIKFVGVASNPRDFSTRDEPINGLMYRDSFGDWQSNDLISVDINTLPIPDRSHFYANRHLYRYLEFKEIATMKTAFSCPQSCAFCYCKQLNGGKYQTRDLDTVMEELMSLKADCVQIVDDDFLADIKRAWSFTRMVKASGLKKSFICYARADEVAGNPDLIIALKEIGFRYFIVGLEAVNDAELLAYDKRTTASINRACIQTIQDAGAQCIALMTVPHTAEKSDFDAIYTWAVDNNLVYTTVSIFTPIPGTPLYELHKTSITSKKIEHWDFLHLVLKPTRLSKIMFYFNFIRLTVRLYLLGKKRGGFSW
ncbi:MAG TPA: B12-binding domain-containing radical SAM protein [Clostridiales bacterium UBA8960]|nr:B12-binding domain-containing radical SAM protein [Clostridiales bacterium UBA8960]